MSGVPRSWPAYAAAALAAVVFLPSLGGDFVYDDHRFYAGNDALVSWDVLWRAFSDPTVLTKLLATPHEVHGKRVDVRKSYKPGEGPPPGAALATVLVAIWTTSSLWFFQNFGFPGV